MKKSTAQLIIVSVIALILVNLTLIGILWNKTSKRGQNQRSIDEMNSFIIKELAFDERQAEEFIKLATIHHTNQKNNREQFRRLKFDLNQKMINGESFEVDSAIVKLAEVTKVKEGEFYKFFTAVLEICNEDQKRRLQQVFFEATGPPDHAKPPFSETKGRRPPR